MLKVEPLFKLDQAFCGPYRVKSVTSTIAVIRPVNDPSRFRGCPSVLHHYHHHPHGLDMVKRTGGDA